MHVRRLLVTALGATGVVLVPLAGPASAHVTVSAPDARQGGFATLTFNAPTERDVPATQLEVAMPTDTPFAFVSIKPKAGWSYRLVKAPPAKPFEAFGEPVTEVVTRIVWTATAGGVKPGEFDEFEISVGPLPEDADRVEFPTLQTYGNGEVVRWIEQTPEGGDEPEHPAPALALAGAEDAEGDGTAAEPAGTQVASPREVDDGASNALAGSALGVGVLALATAGYAVARGRRARA